MPSAKKQTSSNTNNPQPANTNVADFLLNAAQPKAAAKGKSGVPTVTGSEELSDKVAKAYENFKTAESEFRKVESELLATSYDEYEARSRRGEHTKTMNYAGKETGGVQVVYQDRFTALAIEQEAGLRQELPNFDQYFEQKRELELKDTSDEAINKLLSVLGADEFRRLFSIKLSLQAKDDMDQKQFRIDPSVREMCGLKQFKASVKITK